MENPLKMNLQFFAEPSDPQDPPADPPKNEPQDPPANPPKTFTQEDIDKIVADRIARERKKYDGFDDLKTKLADYEKQAEERRLTELSEKERAEELAKKFESEKQTLAQQLEELRNANKREKVANEFIKLATSANIAYIDDAMKLVDLSAVEFDDSGKPVGVDALVTALVQDKPFLLGAKKEPKQIGNSSNPPQEGTQKTAEQLIKEAADKARKSGRIEDMQAYAALKMELGL